MSTSDDPANRPERLKSRHHSAARAVANARRSNKNWKEKTTNPDQTAWKRQSWTLPRREAREKAREFLKKYPKAAYWSEIESWRVLPDDRIEFTMRRLPSAD